MRIYHSVLLCALAMVLVLVSCSLKHQDTAPASPTSPERPRLAAMETEAAGNCLSFPVIWSDGVSKTLRGSFASTVFSGNYMDADDPATVETDPMPWYLQADPYNEWQAESRDELPNGPLDVSRVDWGDNLEARNWTSNSVVRVELVLYQDLTAGDQMVGYRMLKLNDLSGLSEIWGTNTHTYLSNEATVYSGCARLTIQKLSKLRTDPTLSLTWNPVTGQWEGDVATTYFNGGVWEAADGPGYYAAEINVQGKLIYGYNWFVSQIANAPGDYRITFSLNDIPGGPVLNTFMTPATYVMVPVEESTDGALVSSGTTPQGGVGVIRSDHNLTYIDVRIVAASSGGNGRRK